MTLYKTTITPLSNFATTLRGDTIFGQLCWAIRYAYSEETLKNLLADYEENPFLVVSDAFASGYVPKPALPLNLLENEDDKTDKKQIRKKIWLTLDDLAEGKFENAKTNDEVFGKDVKDEENYPVKNSINRLTFTTDDDFAPYSELEITLAGKKDIYFLLDKSKFELDKLKASFECLAQMGYGKNASTGKGRFSVDDFKEVAIKENSSAKSNAFMTLSPTNFQELKGVKKENCYYEPFTRFGKHGAELATSQNPFKSPLLLANTGAVVSFDDERKLQYIGKAIKGHSANADTVHQGYAIVLPTKVERK